MNIKNSIMLVTLCGLLTACEEDTGNISSVTAPDSGATEASLRAGNSASLALATDYWLHQGNQCLSAAAESALQLNSVTEQLLETPSEEALDAVRKQWQLAHNHYIRCRLYTGLGLTPGLQILFDSLHAETDAWPLQPGFILPLPGYPDSGLIGDTTIPLTEQQILSEHQRTSDEDVALGFHAMEVLIWGIPGDSASAEQFLTSGQNSLTERRRRYIRVVAGRIAADTAQLSGLWQQQSAPESGLKSMSRDQQISYLLSSVFHLLNEDLLRKRFSADHSSTGSEQIPFSDNNRASLMTITTELEQQFGQPASTDHPLSMLLKDIAPEQQPLLQNDINSLVQMISAITENSEEPEKTAAIRQKLGQILVRLAGIAREQNLTLTAS